MAAFMSTAQSKAATDLLEADTRLAKLMEDFVRAAQLQFSLKQQIEDFLAEKELELKDQEEQAKAHWLNSQENTRAFQNSAKILKQKINRVENGSDYGKFIIEISSSKSTADVISYDPYTIKNTGKGTMDYIRAGRLKRVLFKLLAIKVSSGATKQLGVSLVLLEVQPNPPVPSVPLLEVLLDQLVHSVLFKVQLVRLVSLVHLEIWLSQLVTLVHLEVQLVRFVI
jgi:hypothetical protein